MIGGRIFTTSCNLRFEIYTFYDDTSSTVVVDTVNATSTPPPPLLPSTTSQDAPPPSLLPPPPSPGPTTTNTSTGVIGARKSSSSRNVVVAVGVLVVVTVVLSFICIYIRVRRSSKSFEPQVHDADDDVEITIVESLQFKFATIRDATNDFSDSNKLGQGGFGVVYRGKLSDGLDIAIKRLSSGSSQGIIEFKNEVVLLAKLQHRNLVRLHGFCIEGRERILVYEFVHNRSLDYFLFDQTRRARLDWGRRYKIIQGIARGILYLHEDSRLRIIHHDLKAGNILLDEEMNPKIADFGMARLCHADQSQGDTNRIVGTYGYMAPEYAMRGHFSAKSDVFSFGVMVLEIVSGRKNSSINHGENIKALLTSITWRNWREGTTTNIVDPTINNGSNYEIMRCIHIGLLCVQKNATARPTMGDIVSMLNNDSVNLIVPSKPAFFVDSRTEFLPNMHSGEYNSGATRSLESNQSTNKTTNVSINDASITELHPR
ncbi:hypothetical protein RIF29_22784 [Crotalaria pallida]|uniref:Protein kinase domain-containing protein n=1 Tax=Crotalaria pallida TaxID=3830 RepID=A0AAN9F6T3_CROPI